MRTNQTLVILTPGFAASEEDTTCLPMQQALVKTWAAMYPELTIVILGFQYPYAERKYNWYGVTVFSFNGRNRGGLQRLLLRRKIYRVLEEVHYSGQIIGLLSFWYGECAALGKQFARKYRLKHCCWLLGQDAGKGNNYPKRYPLHPGEIIALSDFLQEEFERNYAVKPAHVIPPGVCTVTNTQPKSNKDIDILGTGSLIPLKQFEIFLLAVAKIKRVMGTLNVVLIGEGPERKKLETLIFEQSLQGTVHLTGALPYPDVLSRMQRAKVFLHPSRYEGFANVFLEALHGGAQVVSFVQPMRKTIERWYVVNSLDEMTNKTIALLRNPADDTRYNPVFPIEETVQKLMQLYRT